MSKENRLRACRICYSPYRREMEKAVTSGIPKKTVAQKYSQIVKTPVDLLYFSLCNHIKLDHEHKIPNQANGIATNMNGNTPSLNADAAKATTFKLAAETLLKLGMSKIEGLTGKDLLYLASTLQKTHLEGQKVQVQQDSLKLMAAKFFGGFINGEEVHDELPGVESQDKE